MPFLRRRGVMASESDMRRHNQPDRPFATKQPLPRTESTSSLAEANDAVPIPAPPATPPNDYPPSSTSSDHAVTPAEDNIDRPASPPLLEETPKRRRFSMLRFRNASDTQLAAKAKQLAATEDVPPVPRRMFS
jgi:hypothetical protein